ncbi:hypothetical protein, partial [Tritonibacter mobilis]
ARSAPYPGPRTNPHSNRSTKHSPAISRMSASPTPPNPPPNPNVRARRPRKLHDPDLAGKEFDEDGITPGSLILLQVLSQVALGYKEDA